MPKPPDPSRVSSSQNKDATRPGEILIELTQIGSVMRVAVVDVATGTETTFQAPPNAARSTIERIAKDKLNYVMKKGKT